MFHFVYINVIHGYLISLFMHMSTLSMDTNCHISWEVILSMNNVTLSMHRSKLSIYTDSHFFVKDHLKNLNGFYSERTYG